MCCSGRRKPNKGSCLTSICLLKTVQAVTVLYPDLPVFFVHCFYITFFGEYSSSRFRSLYPNLRHLLYQSLYASCPQQSYSWQFFIPTSSSFSCFFFLFLPFFPNNYNEIFERLFLVLFIFTSFFFFFL